MTRGPILHEDGAPSHPEAGPEMLLHYLFVHGTVHLLVGGHEVEAADLAIADRTPDHDFTGVLYRPPDDAGVVSANG